MVVGHNEASSLEFALRLAQRDASQHGAYIVFVDSGSTDGSRAVANACGVPRIAAPIGKGAAVRHALREVCTDWAVSLDADIFEGTTAIVRPLLDECARDFADLVVGDFSAEPGGVASNTWGIYEPLVAELFPEARGRFGTKPLSGFRAVRTTWAFPDLPSDFGLEAYMNIAVATHQGRVEVTRLGHYRGRFLYKPEMGREIGRTILDSAVAQRRLEPERRPEWDEWVEAVVAHVASYRGDAPSREAFRRELLRLAARPLPPASSR